MPHSSLYCVQKSASRASPAARNRKMAASPAVRLLPDCANALVPCTSKPVPTVAPAAVSPVFRKLRRFPPLNRLGFSFILILFHLTVQTALLRYISTSGGNDRTFSARPS